MHVLTMEPMNYVMGWANIFEQSFHDVESRVNRLAKSLMLV